MTRLRAHRIARALALSSACVAATVLGGCGGGLPSLPSFGGNSSPFGSTGSIERTFIGAAQTWDTDKNGSVTCDEWKSYTALALKEADGDGNGSLDATEYGVMARTDRLFEVADLQYFDLNGDSRVTAEEMSGKPNSAFKMLDKNNDCSIDRNETVQVLQVDKPKPDSGGAGGQVPGGTDSGSRRH